MTELRGTILQLQQQVRELVAENSSLAPEEIGDWSNDLFDAGLSSLDCVRILLAIEDDFDVELSEDIINRELFSTIENLAAAVEDAVGTRAG
jgi:acyl carrier protein